MFYKISPGQVAHGGVTSIFDLGGAGLIDGDGAGAASFVWI